MQFLVNIRTDEWFSLKGKHDNISCLQGSKWNMYVRKFNNAVFKLIHSKVCITSQYKNITLWSEGLIKARKQMGLV